MLLKSRVVSVVVLTGLSVGAIGCTDGGSPANTPVTADYDHDHGHEHDHGPETLAAALTQLKGLRDVIRDSFAANDADAAHNPLHDVGHVLEAFETLATKENVPAENAATIKAQVEILFGAFGDVDKTMHGQEGKSWSEVAKSVDDAIAALESACTDQSAGAATTPADDAAAPASDAAETPAAPAADAPQNE